MEKLFIVCTFDCSFEYYEKTIEKFVKGYGDGVVIDYDLNKLNFTIYSDKYGSEIKINSSMLGKHNVLIFLNMHPLLFVLCSMLIKWAQDRA